jgi:hypothetical protein
LGIFSSPEIQLGVIELEFFLAFWLISGIRPLGSWIVGLLTFGGFAAVSAYLGWVGQSSCGCLGKLSVNPWYAFALDTVVIATLLVGRPDTSAFWNRPRSTIRTALIPAAWAVGGMVLISGLVLGIASFCFGSLPAALAYLRGERIWVEPRLLDVGEGVAGDVRKVPIELTNWTNRRIRLIGGTADCSCTLLEDLPVTIPPNETRSVAVSVRLSGAPGIISRKAGFLVEQDGVKRVNFFITGRITTPAREGR